MFEGLLLAPILALLLLLWAWPARLGAIEHPRLTLWNAGRPLRSFIGTLVYGSGAGVCLVAALWMALDPARQWFDAIWLGFLAPLFLWNLALRAAFVDRVSD